MVRKPDLFDKYLHSRDPEVRKRATVDAVEEATGLDFFATIPQPQQEQLESTISVQDWRWKKRK